MVILNVRIGFAFIFIFILFVFTPEGLGYEEANTSTVDVLSYISGLFVGSKLTLTLCYRLYVCHNKVT
jgi:hypothetical protein